MKDQLTLKPQGPSKEEGKIGMFMDYIFLIIVMNLFIIYDFIYIQR